MVHNIAKRLTFLIPPEDTRKTCIHCGRHIEGVDDIHSRCHDCRMGHKVEQP